MPSTSVRGPELDEALDILLANIADLEKLEHLLPVAERIMIAVADSNSLSELPSVWGVILAEFAALLIDNSGAADTLPLAPQACLEAAVKVLSHEEHAESKIAALFNLAGLLRSESSTGNDARAFQCLVQAQQLAQERDDAGATARIALHLGELQLLRGETSGPAEFEDALKSFSLSVELSELQGDLEVFSHAQMGLAAAHERLADTRGDDHIVAALECLRVAELTFDHLAMDDQVSLARYNRAIALVASHAVGGHDTIREARTTLDALANDEKSEISDIGIRARLMLCAIHLHDPLPSPHEMRVTLAGAERSIWELEQSSSTDRNLLGMAYLYCANARVWLAKSGDPASKVAAAAYFSEAQRCFSEAGDSAANRAFADYNTIRFRLEFSEVSVDAIPDLRSRLTEIADTFRRHGHLFEAVEAKRLRVKLNEAGNP